ncbi:MULTISPECIES: DUF1289 domain-containing protein [unclassified Gilliamella]|uniref:DUF1289 domain-containing protein n=1 Tax=unclassified Gilliamella TaxID=2685620 RepID=UPI00130C60EC|nr:MULTISPECIES: DUF1289 domain-containing protein [unclassified Gilliamella]MWP48735.1 DUF1289 domain-containing protein [Gilliamella sp. Lep-s35]MWP68448.1 DUF1289 domain-containing protein [Gilliamella sp. Lep-s5]MWP77006.1 DUF1289 domain-containing protein [Gilliamella sp. Lep-s21]
MDQIEFFDIPSPCKRICETDKQGYCIACYRSRQERFNWLTFNNNQKKEVLRLCKQRALKRHYLLLQQQRQKLNSISSQIELNF